MSLTAKLQDLVSRIAAEFKAIRTTLNTGTVNIGTTVNNGELLRVAGVVRSTQEATSNGSYIDTFSASDTHQSTVYLRKSGLATVGHGATVDGERLGLVEFHGNGGTAFTVAARMRAEQAGAAGTQTPAHIILETSDGTTCPERMRLTSGGNLLIGTQTDNSTDRLQVSGSLASDTVRVGSAGQQMRLRAVPVANHLSLAYGETADRRNRLQHSFASKKILMAIPSGSSTTLSQIGVNISATGTATSANVATTNIHTVTRRLEYAVTTASATAVAGFYVNQRNWHRGGVGNPYGGFFFHCKWGPSRGATLATRRAFVGLSSTTSAPTDTEPTTLLADSIGVGCGAADTNFKIIHRSGTSAATVIDTGIPKVSSGDNTEMYELYLYSSPTTGGIHYEFVRLSNGASFSGLASTNIPAEATLLAPRGHTSVGGTSSVIGFALANLYMESDY